MKIQENVSLKNYNTFGIDVNAKRFISVESDEELKQVLANYKDVFVVSGGSNMLLLNSLNKTVVHLNTKGITIDNLNDDTSLVTAKSGENWHEFVQWCIRKDLGGLENLSLIPGNVGASPIQNIGAYGVEVKDCFYELKAVDVQTLNERIFTKEECGFGYRNSIFKNELKGDYIILDVTFKLTRKNHRLRTDYGAIQAELKNNQQPSIKDVANAVIAIRTRKLPNPNDIGNSGSFFKNPVVNKDIFLKIQCDYKKMPYYKVDEDKIKIPAGWLIEQCGFKGKKYGNAGVYDKQALVLVNYGNATGKEIYELANTIKREVQQKFGVELEMEVNLVK